MTCMIRRSLTLVAAAIVATWSCVAAETPSSQPSKRAEPASAAAGAPMKAPDTAGNDHIQVQHVLIGFQGSVPGKAITRTRGEAEKLAAEVFARAKKGDDFDALVKEYTNDAYPGFYSMSNTGLNPVPPEFPRNSMVKSFGDVGFSLKVGEIGMASYDPQASRFGWHIIKRVK